MERKVQIKFQEETNLSNSTIEYVCKNDILSFVAFNVYKLDNPNNVIFNVTNCQQVDFWNSGEKGTYTISFFSESPLSRRHQHVYKHTFQVLKDGPTKISVPVPVFEKGDMYRGFQYELKNEDVHLKRKFYFYSLFFNDF